MICPQCGYKANLPGADSCQWCQFDLTALDRPAPSDRVEQSLMTDPVSVLEPRAPVSVSDTATLGDAIRVMIDGRVGAVLVTDSAGRLVGVLTERDFLTKVAGSPGFAALAIADFMTPNPECVAPNDPLAFVLSKMAGGGYRHLPVVAAGYAIGVVSVRDVLGHIVKLCHES